MASSLSFKSSILEFTEGDLQKSSEKNTEKIVWRENDGKSYPQLAL